MKLRALLVFCLNFAGATLGGWLVYLLVKFILGRGQRMLDVAILNEFDKVALALIAAFAFVLVILSARRRNQ